MQALALHDKRVPVMPLPSKRTSVNYHGQQRHRERQGEFWRKNLEIFEMGCFVLVNIQYMYFC